MREKILIALAALAGLLLARNLYVMLLELPDEAAQGAIYRIIFFHVPAAWTAFAGFFVALVSSVLYLIRHNLRYDALAVSATEVGLAFGAVNLVTGMIWGRIIWGIWWTWDARLTSMLICWLLYAGYLMLRRAVDDPTQRARFAAVFSIFAFVDVPIVWFSIKWWRTQHPGPVVWGGGSMDPAMYQMLFFNWIPLLLLACALVMLRLRQEETAREIEALRRHAHAL
ncbi:MAG TPA: cytochrome c biogenesis protein CcsA [Bryobacteraceae bacterium]|nr:cytochrome c biogenesis protein CcsA [Bryobacteraceae bacterium]